MGFLKSKAKSNNQAFGYLKDSFSPTIAAGNGAANFMAQLLGISPAGGSSGGTSSGVAGTGLGQAASKIFPGLSSVMGSSTGGTSTGGGDAFDAFQSYKDQAGYAPALRDMQRGVTATGAASGLLRSGAAGNAYLTKGAELDSSMFNNFMSQLAGLAGLGQQAGSTIAGAGSGQQQASTGSKILSGIGKVASIFSDRRTKRDITHLFDLEDGLGVYHFRYLGDEEPRIGVMADEVEDIRPWALGPVVGGFQTVNYSAL